MSDLERDPGERRDLGADPHYAGIIAAMRARLGDWRAARKRRTGLDHATAEATLYPADKVGILIGLW